MQCVHCDKQIDPAKPFIPQGPCCSLHCERMFHNSQVAQAVLLKPKTRNKYNARKVYHKGKVFDSQKEFRRYLELRDWLARGIISDLVLQPRFRLDVNGLHICVYVADYQYVKNGETIVEDVKSKATAKLPVFKLKQKLMKAILGIDVQVFI